MNLNEKYNLLKNNLKQMEKVVVAFSGGVDSSLLLYVATEVLDNANVIACTAAGPTQPLKQIHQAKKFTRTFNIKLVMITPPLMNNKKFTENSPDRCFHCKNIIIESIQNYAKSVGIDNIIFGSNLDDYDDFRPGNEALKMHNICSPLAQAELTKTRRQKTEQTNKPPHRRPAIEPLPRLKIRVWTRDHRRKIKTGRNGRKLSKVTRPRRDQGKTSR